MNDCIKSTADSKWDYTSTLFLDISDNDEVIYDIFDLDNESVASSVFNLVKSSNDSDIICKSFTLLTNK